MRIGLIDVDGHNFPNLALMKISAWHKAQGDTVEWCEPLLRYDRVYKSRVFDDTYSKDIDWVPQADEIICGGTGYDLRNTLPDEVEHCRPDYSLYNIEGRAYGFLSRGCPRACPFCIVAEKEGRCSRRVANLSEFWDGEKEIVLQDPNILASKDHMDLLGQLVESGAWVDFNQGLDVRLVNEKNVDVLNRIKAKRLHFAWDNPRDDLRERFAEVGELLRIKDHRRRSVYVLVNYWSDLEEDLHRIYTLRELDFDPFVMVYDKPNAPKIIRQLQRWCNNKAVFSSCPEFDDYEE